MPDKLKRHLPLILGLLSAALLAVVAWQWRSGGAVDWFSVILVVATLCLLAVYLRQD